MELTNWPILRNLKSYFLKNIRLALVFGQFGNEAILIDRDNHVYGIGANLSGHLGLGDETSRTTPTEIPILCENGIRGLAYGGNMHSTEGLFIIAYFDRGNLYQWGSIPWQENPVLEPKLVHEFKSKVVEVACGYSHCVALCENGQVFTWGTNERGQLGRRALLDDTSSEEESEDNDEKLNEDDNERTDTLVKHHAVDRVKGCLDGEMVIQISCGAQFTVAITSDGRVFSWGSNEKLQLGLDICSEFVCFPTQVHALKNIQIRKVACGRAHVFALGKKGNIVVWGYNRPFNFNAVPVNSNSGSNSMSVPSRLRPWGHPKLLRCTDVHASYLFDFTVVVDVNKKISIFGQMEDRFKNAEYNSVHEAFFRCVSIMPTPLHPPKCRRKIIECAEYAFDNREDCDLIIRVDGKEIPVHKTFLMMRSKFFKTVISRWLPKDSNEKVLTIKEKSYQIIKAYLKYIYTDTLEADLDLAVELLETADEYLDNDFKILCEEIVKEQITLRQVANVYPRIYKMDNVEGLIARCIELAENQPNHLEIMMNAEGYEHWDLEVLQTFLPQYAKRRRLN